LNDLLWIRRKDHKACAAGAAAYLESAVIAVKVKAAHKVKRNFKRAIQLSSRLGRGNDLYQQVVESISATLGTLVPTEDGFGSLHLMELMLHEKIGDPLTHAAQSKSLAHYFLEQGDLYRARAYWEVTAKWFDLADDEQSSKIAQREAAELLVSEAEQRVSIPGNFLAGAGLLSQAIESLRRSGASKPRIEELKARLSEYQETSMTEMKRISGEIDISEPTRKAREMVRGLPLQEAIQKLAMGHGTSNTESLRAEVEENAEKFVLTHLIGGILVDHKGRPIANKGGINGSDEKAREQAIELAMFDNASRFHWSMRVVGFIEPARMELMNEHHPEHDDLNYLVRNNPFVPPGHEGIFLRGLYSGFHGDFLIAAHLLVPQIENSIRYLLESRGVDITNLMSDGTQPVKILGALLGLDATKTMFGEGLIFELRGLLNEKTGYDLRNRIAHGFITTEEGQSIPAVNAWWISLRLCVMSYLLANRNKPKEAKVAPEGDVGEDPPPVDPV